MWRRIARVAAFAALVFASCSAAEAKVIDYCVAAVPTWWNILPNVHDAMTGMRVSPSDSVLHTVVYQHFTHGMAATAS